jgi:hypothetical protein
MPGMEKESYRGDETISKRETKLLILFINKERERIRISTSARATTLYHHP